MSDHDAQNPGPRPAEWQRPEPGRRAKRVDLITAITLFLVSVLSQQLYRLAGIYQEPADGITTLTALAVTILPLALRRTRPILVGILVSIGFIIAGTLTVPEVIVTNIALFLAIYSIGAWSPRRALAHLTRSIIVAVMAIWLVISLFQAATDPELLEKFPHAGALSPFVAYLLIQLFVNVMYFAAAWWFGERAFVAAHERFELEERTRELERERERTAAQAVELDRIRIARELHDAVAHHVSVIGIQAGAARMVLDTDPDATTRALETIEQTSRETITELHDMLVTLRDSDEPTETARGVDQVPELVAGSVDAGIPTSYTVVGEAVGLPAIASVNLYRIAQEALTNVRKHAGAAASADVRLRYGQGFVELEVANTGGVAALRLPGGLGQIGMRERVAASGGTLELGPRSRGGYLVRARIPLPEVGG